MNRPASATVFGILNLVFGLFGLLGAGIGVASMAYLATLPPDKRPGSVFGVHPIADAWMYISIPLGLVGTLVLIASGIGLLMTRPWGRKWAVGYAMYAVVTTIVGIGIQVFFVLPGLFAQAEALPGQQANTTLFGAIGGVIGGSIGLVYPCLLWFFMTRPHVLAAYGGPPLPAPEDAPWHPSAPAASTDPNNPYVPPQTLAPTSYSAGGTESVVGTLVPSKNGPALASYYLGLFSLFPCLGFPLGVAAVYYGLKGLANVRANPEVRGGVHAWIGVICGGLFGLFNFLLTCMAVIGLIGMAMER